MTPRLPDHLARSRQVGPTVKLQRMGSCTKQRAHNAAFQGFNEPRAFFSPDPLTCCRPSTLLSRDPDLSADTGHPSHVTGGGAMEADHSGTAPLLPLVLVPAQHDDLVSSLHRDAVLGRDAQDALAGPPAHRCTRNQSARLHTRQARPSGAGAGPGASPTHASGHTHLSSRPMSSSPRDLANSWSSDHW